MGRSATPATATVITRAGSQPPATSRPGDKYTLSTSKHSAPEALKAKLGPQPQDPPPAKADEGPPLPPREPPSKAGQGSRGSTALQDPEKRLDLLSIFKTYIPKDLAPLYQNWGADGPALEHRGKSRAGHPPAPRAGAGPPGSSAGLSGGPALSRCQPQRPASPGVPGALPGVPVACRATLLGTGARPVRTQLPPLHADLGEGGQPSRHFPWTF